jgi:thiamine biosynthesis lipoprotein
MANKTTYQHASLHMDTVVHIKVVSSQPETMVMDAIHRAFEAFRCVEETCSRFDPESELSSLTRQIERPMKVSPILFEAIRFAWEVAHLTQGVFDPTIGHTMESYGFNRHYLTGQISNFSIDKAASISYLDIVLDESEQTVMLLKPLVLDLGAVAKGLAIDLAQKELNGFEGIMINAGGDIFVGGLNEREEPWLVGIQHPSHKDDIICALKLTNAAICTSGSYERVSSKTVNSHHLIDPLSGKSVHHMVSCTVIAPYAMMADAFSTAAFILGSEKGLAQLENVGLDGLCILNSLEMHMTKEMKGYIYEQNK